MSKLIIGQNDLETWCKNNNKEHLLKEWNYEKNGDLKPTDISHGSGKKVWWKCSEYNHEWQATIENRCNNQGCPYCSNKKVLSGFNDLATTNPELVSEWNYEKNGNLKPTDVTYGSHKKVWWKCLKCKHEWESIINNRSKGIGCPYCSNKKVSPGYNDLATTNPKLASEWNYEKNGNLKPTDVTCSSGKKVWWICHKGHEWQATIDNRNSNQKCPYCFNRRATQGYNDLATINPKLASEWNYGKNGDLKPTDVTCSSGKKVWWKCSKGHEWQSNVANRKNGNGCPYCSNRYIIKGETDLATTNPELASEWNYERNGDLKPTDVTRSSGKKVWWKCSKGHEWKTTINNRDNGTDCPYCSNRKVLPGFNDLATTNPKLAKEWNYEKNGNLKPTGVTKCSDKKVWWKCPKCNHEWQSVINSRNTGIGCPKCHHKPE